MKPRRASRGVTLVEVLIVVALVGVVMGGTALSLNIADGARLKQSAVLIAGAIRVAYSHANATSKVVRLVLDFDERRVTLEEGSGVMQLAKNELSGGAAGATEAERKAIEESEAILKGPRQPRPTFKAVSPLGFTNESAQRPGRELPKNIRFRQIETGHQDEPQKTGRVYLYFWPGGQTERAAVQLSILGSDNDVDILTLIVSPLTGKAELRKGKVSMPRPRDDNEESERRDGL